MFALLLCSSFLVDQPEGDSRPLQKSRKVILDRQAETIPVLIAINTIRLEGDKGDVPVLMKLRNDHRELRGTWPMLTSRVSDAAAFVAVSLLGKDAREFAPQHGEYGLVNPPGVIIRQWEFRTEAERDEAAKKAWDWLDEQAKKK